MDLIKIVRDLQEERRKLDLIITSLEQLHDAPAARSSAPAARRGRKSMNAESRLAVSLRMKEYWATRRKAHAATSTANGAGSSS